MNRSTRIALGLLIPSLTASILLAIIYSYVKALETINPMIVIVMLGFIITSVFSATFTAYFYKGLKFENKRDILFVYLNTYPWVAFLILFADRFWILWLPLLITPILGYWFGKRYSTL